MDAINNITVSDHIKASLDGREIHLQHYFTSHQLRHTFATNAHDKGVTLSALQYLMGHETPEITMRYVGLTRRALLQAREKLDTA